MLGEERSEEISGRLYIAAGENKFCLKASFLAAGGFPYISISCLYLPGKILSSMRVSRSFSRSIFIGQ